jgi:regulator of CtrA degradation
MFERTFAEGMALVEETAAYLDGPGRAASKMLDRIAALAYAGESMRLTTRLMQVASWLLVQRAVREGEISPANACEEKYRFAGRDRGDPLLQGSAELPEALKELIARCDALYARVKRIDHSVYAEEIIEPANPVAAQVAMLTAALQVGPT